ncbi:hypothetical protein HWV62_8192 [Athelia sp. TMB]|nr:hypothetical protein HWV62_8192 [Athelia sp. TMB]
MLPSRLSLEQLVSLVLNDDTHAAATDSNDLHALDAAVVSPAKSLEASVQHIADDGAPHAGASSLTVVMYSCLAALVSVSAVMCVRIYLRKRALRAQMAWELLPRTSDVGAYSDSESSLPKSQEDMLDSTPEDADAHLLATPALLDVKQHPNPWLSPMGSMAARDIPDFDFPNLITFGDQSSDTSSIETITPTDLIDVTEDEEDIEDSNEFFDASTDLLQPTPLPQSTPLPEPTQQSEPIPLPVITISQVGTIEENDSNDPPLPSLGPGPLIREPVVTARPHSPAHRPQHMRELSLAHISRPAWSLRADDDSSLFVPPASKSTDIALSPLMPVESLPPSPVHAPSSPSADAFAFALAVPPPKRRRAFRSPVPEFDIALAMQLRPGLGANADAAWMVRFIMTIFGFLSVMWTNHSNRFTPIKMRQQRIAAYPIYFSITPLKKRLEYLRQTGMPHSHHSHSGQFCKHASGLLEEVVLAAVQQGFELYGLTEHVPRYREEDMYPEERGESLDVLTQQFEDFLHEAHRLKTKYQSSITLLVGLETELITPSDLERLQELLLKHGNRVEYLVGSVHHVNGVPIDFDIGTFDKALSSLVVSDGNQDSDAARMEALLSDYFDAQHDLMRRFKPEIIGHFDLCRLYHPELRFSDYPLVWEKIVRNVHFAIEYGALFEANAAAFRKGWQSAYPAGDIIQVFGTVITFRSFQSE